MEHSDRAMARQLAERVAQAGGRVYFVGGCVRDALLGKPVSDLDVEVHGIAPARLEEILDSLGQRLAMGESFGIYGLRGYGLDIAMPRKEAQRGRGHRDFDVFVDPFIGVEAAARRRDFTVNAMMEDVLTGEILDPFGGREDLRRGVLRHVGDDTFPEDALRVLRCAQFAARFAFSVAPQTVRLCASMDLTALPRERILGELEKALLKAEKPSIFFETLREMQQLDFWFPELKALIGVPQSRRYHAEGDVWNHTMLVLDQAARLRHHAQEPFAFMLAALTHDFGKPLCTEVKGDAIHAYNHEKLGLPVITAFLNRLMNNRKYIAYTLNLAANHMRPNKAAQARSRIKSTNRMFDESIDPEALVCIALADDLGRISQYPTGVNHDFLLQRLAIYREYMTRPFVKGEDLVAAGLKPDKHFKEILDYAHKLRLAGIDKESALRQTLAYAGKVKGKPAEA